MEVGVIYRVNSLSYLFALIGRWIAGRGEMDSGERGIGGEKVLCLPGDLVLYLEAFGMTLYLVI